METSAQPGAEAGRPDGAGPERAGRRQVPQGARAAAGAGPGAPPVSSPLRRGVPHQTPFPRLATSAHGRANPALEPLGHTPARLRPRAKAACDPGQLRTDAGCLGTGLAEAGPLRLPRGRRWHRGPQAADTHTRPARRRGHDSPMGTALGGASIGSAAGSHPSGSCPGPQQPPGAPRPAGGRSSPRGNTRYLRRQDRSGDSAATKPGPSLQETRPEGLGALPPGALLRLAPLTRFRHQGRARSQVSGLAQRLTRPDLPSRGEAGRKPKTRFQALS